MKTSLLPTSRREILLILGWSSLLIVTGFAVSLGHPDPASIFHRWPLVLSLMVAGVALALIAFSFERERVDVWAEQRGLMKISNQALPMLPEINPTSLRYLGLMAEELAETAEATCDAMGLARWDSLPPGTFSNPRQRAVALLMADLDTMRRHLQESSADIAKRCKALPPDLVLDLSPEDAKQIADGATDMTVIAAGFALASGIPGPACYTEVVGSNVSKKNPITGLIDKDPSGKWIKGLNYRAPDLLRVLSEAGAIRPLPFN